MKDMIKNLSKCIVFSIALNLLLSLGFFTVSTIIQDMEVSNTALFVFALLELVIAAVCCFFVGKLLAFKRILDVQIVLLIYFMIMLIASIIVYSLIQYADAVWGIASFCHSFLKRCVYVSNADKAGSHIVMYIAEYALRAFFFYIGYRLV